MAWVCFNVLSVKPIIVDKVVRSLKEPLIHRFLEYDGKLNGVAFDDKYISYLIKFVFNNIFAVDDCKTYSLLHFGGDQTVNFGMVL